MALNTDQMFMLMQLADYAGQRLNPDPETNPFGGYASQIVAARNFSKLLQEGATPTPDASAPAAEEPPAQAPSAMENPFVEAPAVAPSPGIGYRFDAMPEVTPEHRDAVDLGDLFMTPGVDVRSDADNNVTATKKWPATTNTGAKKSTMKEAVANPFLLRG